MCFFEDQFQFGVKNVICIVGRCFCFFSESWDAVLFKKEKGGQKRGQPEALLWFEIRNFSEKFQKIHFSQTKIGRRVVPLLVIFFCFWKVQHLSFRWRKKSLAKNHNCKFYLDLKFEEFNAEIEIPPFGEKEKSVDVLIEAHKTSERTFPPFKNVRRLDYIMLFLYTHFHGLKKIPMWSVDHF